MAYTFRGFGLMRYGKREFEADGSCVTTLWFVCFYVPVVPIRSERILPTREVKYYGMQPRQTLVCKERTKPNLSQVLSTYAWWAAVLTIFIAAKVEKSWWMTLPGMLLLGLPFVLRRRALERVKAEVGRAAMGLSPEI